MARKSILEMKIRWYLNSVEPTIDKESLELIIMSEFDDNGQLRFVDPGKHAEKYDKYWKNLQARLEKLG